MPVATLVMLVGSAQAEDLRIQNTVLVDVSRSMESTDVVELTEGVLDTWQGWRGVAPGGRTDWFQAVTFAAQASEELAPSSPDGLNGVFLEPPSFGGRADLAPALTLVGETGEALVRHAIVLTDGGITDGPLPTVPPNVVVHAVATGDIFPLEGIRLRALTASTGGSYIQADSNAEFQVGATWALQQSLQGNTWHVARTTRLEAATDAFRVDVPGTVGAVSILAVAESGADVSFEALPPSVGAGPLMARGTGRATLHVPASQLPLGGEWTVASTSDEPIHVMMMVDNFALQSDLVVSASDIRAGEPIDIEVMLSAFGAPVADEDVTLTIEVRAPGQGVGDLLSDFGGAAPDEGEDPPSTGAALLAQLLEDQPDALDSSTDEVPWTSDSSGRFVATYRPPVAGTYQVRALVSGTSGQTGAFAFEHLETFYASTRPEDTLVEIEGGRVSVVPSTRDLQERLGPGYEGRLWLDIAGREPIPLVDQLDGAYEADLDGADAASLQVLYVPPLLAPDAFADATTLPGPDEIDDAPDGELLCGCTTPGAAGWAWLVVPLVVLRRRTQESRG